MTTSRSWFPVRLAAAVLVLGLGAPAPAHAVPSPAAPRDDAVTYRAPLDGEVLRRFEPPARPWTAGHRGVDLAARRGQRVRTAAAGTVVFAGAVGGPRWVSVDHADGVRTSYGPLADVLAAVGQAVPAGSVLGTAASGHADDSGDAGRVAVHWSARRDGTYLDPLSLLDGARRWRPALVGPGATGVADHPDVPGYAPWAGRRGGFLGVLGFVDGSPVATEPGWALPPNPNHVIGVAGLSSYTGRVPLDLAHLGYPPEQTTYLSYAGRHDDVTDPSDPSRDQLPYVPADTWEGVHTAALKLREQLRAHQASRPGEAVDLVGHSMGGLVVLHYLLHLHDPADPGLPPVAHVVTIASPVEGADLATGLRTAAEGSAAMRLVLDAVGRLADQPALTDQAAVDLALGSDVVRGIATGWEHARADHYGGPLAIGTQVLTLGGSRDVIVPERRSDLPGTDHVVLPGGHDRVRLTEASRTVVRSFLADRPLPGGPGGLGHVLSYPLGWGQQLAGRALAALP